MTLNGNVSITGNTKDATADNVYLTSGETLTIGGFSTLSRIGVATAQSVSGCAKGVNITGTVSSDISSCFTPDVDGLIVDYKDNKLRLIEPHSYNSTYSCDDDQHWHECSVCGQKYGSLGAHNYSTAWTAGTDQHWHACQTAGCTDKSDTADHTFVQKKDGTNHWQECSVCGYKKDVTAHAWGSWELTADPTLKTTGEAERTCSCGEKQTKTDVPALTDTTVWTMDSGSRKDPTIKDKGSEDYTSEYGTVTLPIPELTDPIWTKVSRTDPTLDGTGSEKYTNTDYGDVTITIPALTDPIWIKDDSKHVEPTEEDTGKDVYISEYGEVEVILPAKEHTHVWGNWTITTEPTITATGTAKRVCTKNAEHTDTKTLPALTDTSVWTKADDKHVDPTKDNDGKDVYTSEYGEVIVVLPALGHTHEWGGWTITTAPTLTETGTAQRVCTLNNTHIDTKTLPALRRFFNFFSQFFCFTLKKQCFAKNILLFCQKMIFCKSDFL